MSTPAKDPVRQRHIDALTRRSAQHQGAARRLLDARLLQLQAAPQRGLVPGAQPASATPPLTRQAAFKDLLAHIGRHQGAPGELKAVRDYGGTWARLAVDRRLNQSLAKVPDQAGPLNTQRLLHQALTVMQNASPAYLQQFMHHVESLLALDPLTAVASASTSASASVVKKDGVRSARNR